MFTFLLSPLIHTYLHLTLSSKKLTNFGRLCLRFYNLWDSLWAEGHRGDHKRDRTDPASGSLYSYTQDSNLQYLKKKLSMKTWKKRPQKLLIICHFFSVLLIWPKIENPFQNWAEAPSVISTFWRGHLPQSN